MERKVKILTTYGYGEFVEEVWTKPENATNEIEVKAVMTGVCRSDIDMMMGQFALPKEMHGHEGLGIVTAVGDFIRDVKVGDYVATRGEPAYADYYNAKVGTYIKVPELAPKYIVEPIACGINVFESIDGYVSKHSRVCILGTGFLSSVVYQCLIEEDYSNIEVIGQHNHPYWLLKHGLEVKPVPTGKYDLVIDLSNKSTALTEDIYSPNATLVMAAAKHPAVPCDFNYLLWNAVTIFCPSPRNPDFYSSMDYAVDSIKFGTINVDTFWTKGYNRETEWRQAFEDSLNRAAGFNRAFIYWP